MHTSKKILVLDDDVDIGQMLQMMLEFKGYQVLAITRTDQLLPALNENQYDLLILDMLIGAENGCDVCRMLKSNPEFSGLPVLLFSALPDARASAMNAGANDFIAKPFEMQLMYDKLKTMMDAEIAGKL